MAHNSKPDKKKLSSIDIAAIASILVAVIGCIGSIVAAAVGTEPFASWMVGVLPQLATPTIAYVASVVPTDTPSITPDPTVMIQFSPGEDWVNNCIDKQWVIYPFQEVALEPNGCYQQPILESISTRGGELYILAQIKNLISAKEYGLFVRAPQSGTVRLKVDLETIDNGEVWFGIFSDPNVKTNGLLIVAPPGNVKEHVFAVRTMPDQKRVDLTKTYSNSSGMYSVGFDLSYGSINAVIENTPRDQFAFSSVQRWLFIGYRAKLDMKNGNADIEALVKDLVITPQ